MTREYVIDTPLGPIFVSETGTRTENINGVFVSETIVVPAQTAFQSNAFENDAFQVAATVSAGTWLATAALLSSLTKNVNGLARASIKTFGGLTP